MTKKMLDGAYELDTSEATQAFYNEWAASYETEVSENGYATPARLAGALADFAEDKTAPILDIGCGTGMAGAALEEAGFEALDGCDFSPQMLEIAQSNSIYRNLIKTDLENPFPFEPGNYAHVVACGVLNPGHAPASTLDAALELLASDGLFAFSLNDHALADNSFEARINDNVDSGNATLLFREHGPHLPKIDMQSTVYILQKS